MRTKRAFGMAVLLSIMLLAIPTAFACEPPPEPGHSPGYWKHQCQVWVTGRGHLHETNIEWLATQTSAGDVYAAYAIFKDPGLNWMWLDLANEFNAAAGYGPYIE